MKIRQRKSVKHTEKEAAIILNKLGFTNKHIALKLKVTEKTVGKWIRGLIILEETYQFQIDHLKDEIEKLKKIINELKLTNK